MPEDIPFKKLLAGFHIVQILWEIAGFPESLTQKSQIRLLAEKLSPLPFSQDHVHSFHQVVLKVDWLIAVLTNDLLENFNVRSIY